MVMGEEGTMDDRADPFGEFFHGKSDEELSKTMEAVARMLWLYYHNLREQGFDRASAMMLVLEVQNSLWPKAET